MQIHNLFPIPVGFFDRNVTDQEKKFLLELEQRPNQGNNTSKNNVILQDPTISDLKTFLETSVNEYFKNVYQPKYHVNLRITQSWVNYSASGQYHHKHSHSNSYISGVYYIQTNPNDRIYFYRDGWQQIKFSSEHFNPYNSDSWWFEAIQGKLILFPSSLTHMVPTVQGDVVRVSLSFNTFPMGIIGEEMDLTGLQLSTQE